VYDNVPATRFVVPLTERAPLASANRPVPPVIVRVMDTLERPAPRGQTVPLVLKKSSSPLAALADPVPATVPQGAPENVTVVVIASLLAPRWLAWPVAAIVSWTGLVPERLKVPE
jgi:hypothetical protein